MRPRLGVRCLGGRQQRVEAAGAVERGEVVSDLTTRAGFPPVLLSPVNFEAIYAQQRQQQQPAEPQVQIITPTSH